MKQTRKILICSEQFLHSLSSPSSIFSSGHVIGTQEEHLRDPFVSVEPPVLEDLRVSALGNSIRVSAKVAPETAYRITLRQGVRDSFGQTLLQSFDGVSFPVVLPKTQSGRSF